MKLVDFKSFFSPLKLLFMMETMLLLLICKTSVSLGIGYGIPLVDMQVTTFDLLQLHWSGQPESTGCFDNSRKANRTRIRMISMKCRDTSYRIISKFGSCIEKMLTEIF